MDTMEKECCIRGYHVYSDVWEAAIDEELYCKRELSNTADRCAVASMADDWMIADSGPSGSGSGDVARLLNNVAKPSLTQQLQLQLSHVDTKFHWANHKPFF